MSAAPAVGRVPGSAEFAARYKARYGPIANYAVNAYDAARLILRAVETAARRKGGLPARGEVWWCELPEIGRRPVVILSRDAAIPRLRRAVIAPCTTTIRGLASEVVLEPGKDPVPRRSGVNLDSLESVSIAVLVDRLGRLSDERMRQVCAALGVAVDCVG